MAIKTRLALLLRAVAYSIGIIELISLMRGVEFVWLPGPSEQILTRALFPLSFLLITTLYVVATRLRIFGRGGFSMWFDTLSYGILVLLSPGIANIKAWETFSAETSIAFVALIAAKLAVLFAGIYRGLNRDSASDHPRDTTRAPRDRRFGRSLLACIFLSSWAFLFLLGIHAATRMCAQPDEPFYLLIAQSIIKDGDLDLNNNLEARDYAPYYHSPLLPQRDVNRTGRYISRHGVLFSLLLAPFYLVLGRVGAMTLSCLAYALFCTLVFWLSRRETRSSKTAFWTWLVAVVAVPGSVYSTQIYPESLACLLLMVLLVVMLEKRSIGLTIAGVVAAAALPWLKARYALIMVPVVVLLLPKLIRPGDSANVKAERALQGSWYYLLTAKMRSLKEPVGRISARLRISRAEIAVGTAVLASCILALLFYRGVTFRLFGGMNIDDVLRLEWSRCWYKLFALFLDWQYGLLIYSPIFLLSILGLLSLIKGRHPLSCVIACGCIPYLIALSSLGWWFGGGCPPCRYLVCLLPFLLLSLSFSLASLKGPIARSFFIVSIIYSSVISLSMAAFPSDRYMIPGESNKVLDRPFPDNIDLTLVPSFIRENSSSCILVAALVTLILLSYGFTPGRSRDKDIHGR
ncbi:MAG: hypothetical protein JW941_11055 [Candidatus Coatesbacteria bacterium]|nr:hypothetical protein [Candidatus Coatesbacteria bacterium]